MEKSKIDEILGSLGFGLPENEIEIKAFDESFRNYRFEADETKINSEEILKNLRPKIKPTNIDFHRRTVLAAEIVFKLHKENTLGHLKLQKLIYLCQHSAQMNLHTNFLKQAMGPYDNRLMRSLDKKFRENQWFTFSSNDYLKYQPLEKVGGHREWYERYFSNELSDIDFIIEETQSGEFKVGAGYSDSSGAIFNIVVKQDNFLGKGNNVSLELERSSYKKLVRYSNTNPYFTNDGMSKSTSLDTSISI